MLANESGCMSFRDFSYLFLNVILSIVSGVFSPFYFTYMNSFFNLWECLTKWLFGCWCKMAKQLFLWQIEVHIVKRLIVQVKSTIWVTWSLFFFFFFFRPYFSDAGFKGEQEKFWSTSQSLFSNKTCIGKMRTKKKFGFELLVLYL